VTCDACGCVVPYGRTNTCSARCSGILAGRASALARDRAERAALGDATPELLEFVRSERRKAARKAYKIAARAAARKAKAK
jgi:hypothetical protein